MVDNWWNLNTVDEVLPALWATVIKLHNEDSGRLQDYDDFQRAYEEICGGHITGDKTTVFTVASVCESFMAHIGRNQIAPIHISVGGGYEGRSKARKKTLICKGVLYNNEHYRRASEFLLHATVYGTAVMKVEVCDGKVKLRRMFPHSLKVDGYEAKVDKPLNYYLVDNVSKESLLEEYEDLTEDDLSSGSFDWGIPMPEQCNVPANSVPIVEAWHIGTKRNPGKHVIATNNKILLHEDWEFESPPIAVLRMMKKCVGFWGQSIVSRTIPSQDQSREYSDVIHANAILHASPPTWVHESSNVQVEQINNFPGIILRYSGNFPPIPSVTPNLVAPDLYRIMEDLRGSPFRDLGLSELTSQQKIPAGLESGKALRTLTDIETGRHVLPSVEWELWHVEIAKIIDDACKRAYAEDSDFEVQYVGRGHAGMMVKYGKADTDTAVQIFPMSTLPQQPGARLQQVEEMQASGLISPLQAMELANIPDLEETYARQMSGLNLIYHQMDRMIIHGEAQMPYPFSPLDEAFKVATEELNFAITEDLPTERFELLLRYAAQAKALMAKLEPPPQPQPPMGAPPGAPPMGAPPGGAPSMGVPQPPQPMGAPQ